MLWAAILVAAVAGLALWLRRQGESSASMTSLPPRPPDDDLSPLLDAEDDPEWELDDAAAVTVDGLAFIGEEHGVSLVPTPDPLAPAPGPIVPVEFLRPGDLTAARVVRGAPSVDPWRLELLGRDGEYMSYGFEVEEAARAALDLLEERSVISHGRSDDDRPVAPSAEQFEEAKRRHDETIRLLALGDEGEGAQPIH